ncbi:hypothetical protein RCH09_001819 [Actimicrobium sp. GrIS 1.19]|uniref:hypothetical protein n=1 Tax=Actimicrobium sp. GrIS 1.19 TaxID=3071708 RepID=UPI002DFD3243|nr:hypothetical protein [Actimicrobium sp. GrIS 1.19]
MAATTTQKPPAKPAAKAPAKAVAKAPAKRVAASVTAKPKAPVRAAAKTAPAVKSKAPVVVKPQTVVKAAAPKAKPAVAAVANGVAAKVRPATEVKEKAKKAKLVRDSFTMPELEYAALGEVKKACLKAGFEVKKSELLRIGVALIKKMDLVALKSAVGALSPLKPGRPRNDKPGV